LLGVWIMQNSKFFTWTAFFILSMRAQTHENLRWRIASIFHHKLCKYQRVSTRLCAKEQIDTLSGNADIIFHAKGWSIWIFKKYFYNLNKNHHTFSLSPPHFHFHFSFFSSAHLLHIFIFIHCDFFAFFFFSPFQSISFFLLAFKELRDIHYASNLITLLIATNFKLIRKCEKKILSRSDFSWCICCWWVAHSEGKYVRLHRNEVFICNWHA
jgi:hypothetical protein